MKRSRILVVLFIIVIACFAAMPVFAETEPEVITASYSHINPLYENFVFQKTLLATETKSSDKYYDTISEAAAVLRTGMEKRVGTIRVQYASADGYFNDLHYQIFQEAIKHTGEPTQGDYLLWHYGGYNVNIKYYIENGTAYASFTYNMQYLSTAQMEWKMNTAVDALLLELDVEDKTDYEKVCAVYDYMCENITYDYAGLAIGSNTAHTAYGALVNKTSVCQGYASLFYRLMLELDVDARIIAGIGADGDHGWNIVEISGRYYNLDSTWDAACLESGLNYQYFLKCDENFEDHQRRAEYATAEFYREYPMSVMDYKPEQLTFTLNNDGKSYYVSACRKSAGGELIIPAVYNGKAVTGIGASAFRNCNRLTSIAIPYSVTSIGEYAFNGCTALSTVIYCGTPTQWKALSIKSYNEPLMVTPQFHNYENGDCTICNKYTVTFEDWNGTVLSTNTYHLGDKVVVPADPVRGAEGGIYYAFSGWNKEITACNGDAVYTATYTKWKFSDVTVTSWQIPFVAYVCNRGLMAGKGTNADGSIKFDPNSSITREEFVQVLYNSEGKPSVSIANKFSDVSEKGWYKNAVLWANANNVANGGANNKFGVGANITRQDLAMMLYKYAIMKGCDLSLNAGAINAFADGNKVANYARTAMYWAVTQGILSGKGTTGSTVFYLDPTGTATRAECAAMLKNFMNAFGQ